MSLTETINEQLKTAMKSGDKLRLETLRSLRAGILEFEKSGVDRAMTPDDEFKILNSAAKKRKDAIEQYEAVGRTDAAEQERSELAIIMEFLPEQMSREEIDAAVADIARQVGASQQSDFGKLMGAATKALKGKADGGAIQQAAKALLSGS
ncbi:MAG: GatB/YqeY domain-containing protein [Candidatus Kapabacteria bacterium]|nr:GatB/YqeY domain-containing protein [Candidatus Kapabacteria bacterium]